VDPLAGSYLIESLTDEIYQRAQAYIAQIDDMGGALSAIEAGFINAEIENAAYEYQKQVEQGEQVVVGVNKFIVQEEEIPDMLRVDPAIEEAQKQKLAQLRAERDNERVNELRGRLDTLARGSENLMPLIIECVENDVTLGEIAHTLRGAFGEYRPPAL
ncbi:MAG: methylmalonyl-CoA mutase, partial [Phototrophicales bacterium]